MKTKNIFLTVSLSVFFTFLLNTVFAQPCPPGCPSVFMPIDGGLSFLIVAGAAYGVKKIHDSRKK